MCDVLCIAFDAYTMRYVEHTNRTLFTRCGVMKEGKCMLSDIIYKCDVEYVLRCCSERLQTVSTYMIYLYVYIS